MVDDAAAAAEAEHEAALQRCAAVGRDAEQGDRRDAEGVVHQREADALVGRALFAHEGLAFGQAYCLASPLLWGFGAGSVAHGLSRGRRAGAAFWLALVVFLAVRLWKGA